MARWRDTKWWIALLATLILGIASLFLSVPPRKRLVIEQDAQTPLFLQRFPGTQITVDGKALTGAYAKTFGICNCGSVPITPSDFDGPITLRFGANELLIPASYGTTTPDGLPVSVAANGSVLEIKPLLLNPGDTICLSVLTTDAKPPEIRARIAGMTTVEFRDLTAVKHEVFHQFYFLDWPVGLALTILGAILLAATSRLVAKARFVVTRRLIELLVAVAACWLAGLLLLDYGARSLGLYDRFPSRILQAAFFVCIWLSAAWLFARSRRAMEAARPAERESRDSRN